MIDPPRNKSHLCIHFQGDHLFKRCCWMTFNFSSLCEVQVLEKTNKSGTKNMIFWARCKVQILLPPNSRGPFPGRGSIPCKMVDEICQLRNLLLQRFFWGGWNYLEGHTYGSQKMPYINISLQKYAKVPLVWVYIYIYFYIIFIVGQNVHLQDCLQWTLCKVCFVYVGGLSPLPYKVFICHC